MRPDSFAGLAGEGDLGRAPDWPPGVILGAAMRPRSGRRRRTGVERAAGRNAEARPPYEPRR